METTAIWDKLENDNRTDIDWVTEHEGLNGFEMLKDRVLQRLRDDTTNEDAQTIFKEEFDKV